MSREHIDGVAIGGAEGLQARGALVDAADFCVRVRASDEGGVQHAGEMNVVDEASFAAQQREARPLLARQGEVALRRQSLAALDVHQRVFVGRAVHHERRRRHGRVAQEGPTPHFTSVAVLVAHECRRNCSGGARQRDEAHRGLAVTPDSGARQRQRTFDRAR